jgi:hypothetical protein
MREESARVGTIDNASLFSKVQRLFAAITQRDPSIAQKRCHVYLESVGLLARIDANVNFLSSEELASQLWGFLSPFKENAKEDRGFSIAVGLVLGEIKTILNGVGIKCASRTFDSLCKEICEAAEFTVVHRKRLNDRLREVRRLPDKDRNDLQTKLNGLCDELAQAVKTHGAIKKEYLELRQILTGSSSPRR